ncbi:MAG: hypothetical protein IGQ88_00190 [Gloeomargaritaceae cyanobacterium C42_A2020_066]|nr:hypothetical protein [Gloeomargaritaceae cyanobacterium C42_A2020_066]
MARLTVLSPKTPQVVSQVPPLAPRPRRSREVTLGLAIHLALLLLGIGAVARLIPHLQQQQVRIEKLDSEVAQAEHRVGTLRHRFTASFDPQQAETMMMSAAQRLYPHQKRIVWQTRPAEASSIPSTHHE